MSTQNPKCECLQQLYPELLQIGNNPKVHQPVNKQIVVSLYSGVLLSNKKIQITDVMWMNLKCIMLSERRSHSHDILEKVKFRGEKRDLFWGLRSGRGVVTKGHERTFLIMVVNTRLCVVKIHRNL